MDLITIRESTAPSNLVGFPGSLGLQDEELSMLTRHASLKSFSKNKIIVSEGERTTSIYAIREGKVKEFLHGKNGREISLGILGAGEYFGEMSLDDGPRCATVRTLEPAELFVVPKWVFAEFVTQNPEFAMRLIKTMIHRTRSLLNNVRNIATSDVYGRVTHLLHEMASEEDGRLVIKDKLTQQDIANKVGASRETICRLFKDLVRGGYVELGKTHITIARRLPERW